MAVGYWVIRTYEAGPVGEKTKYWVPGERPPRSERRIRSEIHKQEENEASSQKCVARLIHANFRDEDYLLTLRYDDLSLAKLGEGLSAESEDRLTCLFFAAHHQLKLWLRRVRRATEKEGIPFRYLAITSDMDPKTGEYKRLHHHVIVNREALALCLSLWKNGSTHKGHLWKGLDKTDLARYLLAQVRRMKENQMKYIPSRNLTRPKPKDRIAKSDAEVRLPRGARLLHRSEYVPGRPQYIRYLTAEALQAIELVKRE